MTTRHAAATKQGSLSGAAFRSTRAAFKSPEAQGRLLAFNPQTHSEHPRRRSGGWTAVGGGAAPRWLLLKLTLSPPELCQPQDTAGVMASKEEPRVPGGE